MNELFQEILEIGNSNLTKRSKTSEIVLFMDGQFLKKPNLPIMNNIYNLYLMNEDTSFAIDQPPIFKNVSFEAVEEALDHYHENGYLTEEEAVTLLDYDLDQTRKSFGNIRCFY